MIEQEQFIPNRNYGRGIIGVSLPDHERSHSKLASQANSLVEWGKRKIRIATQSLVIATTLLTGSVSANATERASSDTSAIVDQTQEDSNIKTAESLQTDEIPNDFGNLTFLVAPNAWQVGIGRGTFWDFGGNSEAGIRQLELQIQLDRINRGDIVDLGLEIPIIIPTNPDGPFAGLQGSVSDPNIAAQMFGVPGYRSSNPNEWSINEFGQAVLKDGNLTRIRTNGAVVDTAYNSKNGPQGVVLRPEIGEYVAGNGTFWLFGTSSDAGVRQIVRGQMARGLNPYVMYAVRGKPEGVGLSHMFVSKPELVARFGVAGTRSATFNLPNGDPVWDVDQYGGATLWPEPSGLRTPVRPNGAVIEVKGGER